MEKNSLVNNNLLIKELKSNLQAILDQYLEASKNSFVGNAIANFFKNIKERVNASSILPRSVQMSWSVGKGSWAKVPWIAFLDFRETTTTQKGIYVVYLFCEDMSGLYLTLNQGVTEYINRKETTRAKARGMLRANAESLRTKFELLTEMRFNLDNNIDLHCTGDLGRDYEYGTIAYKYYKAGELPGDEQLSMDLHYLLEAYTNYVDKAEMRKKNEEDNGIFDVPKISLDQRVTDLIDNIAAQGYHFQPWQIAAYITALRTKPFVILAGVSGTGKSKLPQLVCEATGGECLLLPVKPDWTDSSEVIGYSDLQGHYRPGSLLEWAYKASNQLHNYHVCIMDEMNLARVEHYFAEVLSQIENRRPDSNGGYESGTLVNQELRKEDEHWGKAILPANLAIVGTVNMDESAYGFSRKVLDRAFTIEFSEIDLKAWEGCNPNAGIINQNWPVSVWQPRAIRLSQLTNLKEQERNLVNKVVKVLTEINSILVQAQLQVGYRIRDEIALFVLNAQDIKTSFVTSTQDMVNPLDLALQMKILPRILGGSAPVRQVIIELLGWATRGQIIQEVDAENILDSWINQGRPFFVSEALYPRTAARLCLMWERLLKEGFTSFWM